MSFTGRSKLFIYPLSLHVRFMDSKLYGTLNVFQDECCPGVLKALETETAYRHGKGQKTKSIVEIVQV